MARYKMPSDPNEIAKIDEVVRFSGGGVAAIVFLVLFQMLMLLLQAVVASAVQQAALGTVWIAGISSCAPA
jgi:hypothetical protein